MFSTFKNQKKTANRSDFFITQRGTALSLILNAKRLHCHAQRQQQRSRLVFSCSSKTTPLSNYFENISKLPTCRVWKNTSRTKRLTLSHVRLLFFFFLDRNKSCSLPSGGFSYLLRLLWVEILRRRGLECKCARMRPVSGGRCGCGVFLSF